MEEITYQDAGFVFDWDYDGEFKISVSCCSSCMGLVYSSKEDSHTKWHRKLEAFYPSPDVQITVKESE